MGRDGIAIVTGGLSGIGQATAQRLREDGFTVVAADVSASETTWQEGGISTLHVDIADRSSVDAMVSSVIARFGRIDCLVQAAGVGLLKPFLETEAADFDRVIAVNLRGCFVVAQAVAREMVRTGGGTIVNVASISGVTPSYDRAAYAASKGGVVQFTRIMAVDLAAKNIRVNAIAPGPVNTPMIAHMAGGDAGGRFQDRIALQRYAEPQEVAAAIAFLCSPGASYVNGHVLAVDGGFLSSGLLPPGVDLSLGEALHGLQENIGAAA